jgi:hypothetical protein
VFGTTDGGASWHCVDPNDHMHAIWGASSSEITAVGAFGTGPQAMTFDGQTWTTVALTGGTELTGIWNGYVTGAYGDLYSWDGGPSLKSIIPNGNT